VWSYRPSAQPAGARAEAAAEGAGVEEEEEVAGVAVLEAEEAVLAGAAEVSVAKADKGDLFPDRSTWE